MANYFLDTEFLEGTQKTFFGESKPTIDLISIGLVSEDGREYYAISKDFNLKEAWNRYQMKEVYGDNRNRSLEGVKEYWIRENVLKNLFNNDKYNHYEKIDTFQGLKSLVNHFGKTNKQIAEEVINFIYSEPVKYDGISNMHLTRLSSEAMENIRRGYLEPIFYGYYCDYDHVCLSWLYGTMSNLPIGFPQYTKDIQQLIDDNKINKELLLKEVPQVNCHNALQDAIWNKNAYSWIKNKINK